MLYCYGSDAADVVRVPLDCWICRFWLHEHANLATALHCYTSNMVYVVARQ